MKNIIPFRLLFVLLLIQLSPLCLEAQWWDANQPGFGPTFPSQSTKYQVYEYTWCSSPFGVLLCYTELSTYLDGTTTETLFQDGALAKDKTHVQFLNRSKFIVNCSPSGYVVTSGTATRTLTAGGTYSYSPNESTFNYVDANASACVDPNPGSGYIYTEGSGGHWRMWKKSLSGVAPFDYSCTACNVTAHVLGWGAYDYVLLELDANTAPPSAPVFSDLGGAGSNTGNLAVVKIETLQNAVLPNTPGKFRISRSGSTNSTLSVTYSRSGTATYGTDYVTSPTGTTVTIPVNSTYLDVTLTPYSSGMGKVATFTLSSSSSYNIDYWRSVANVNIFGGQ